MVRQHQQPAHPPRLRKRGEGLHALRRHFAPGGIPHRDPRASDRLARRAAPARARRRDDPAPAGLAGLAVRISLREERRHPQPGQRRRAAEDRKRRRQDAGDRRPPGARPARRARRGHRQEQARPRRPVDAAVPRAAPRGAVQAEGEGFPARAQRRAASESLRQGRQDALSAAASGHPWTDQRLSRRRRARPRRQPARCSGRSATTAPAGWKTRSPRTASIAWCGAIRGSWGF